MAQIIIGTFSHREAAQDAVGALQQSGVPTQDIAISKHGIELAVATEAILGSAVDDMMRQAGATKIEVEHDESRLLGWERYDPHNDPPLASHPSDDASEWQRSSKIGTAAGAVAGATVGAELGVVGGPIGIVVGGLAGAAFGAATGAAGDIAGKLGAETFKHDDDEP